MQSSEHKIKSQRLSKQVSKYNYIIVRPSKLKTTQVIQVGENHLTVPTVSDHGTIRLTSMTVY